MAHWFCYVACTGSSTNIHGQMSLSDFPLACRMLPDVSPPFCRMPPDATYVKMSGTSEQLLAWRLFLQPRHTVSRKKQGGGGGGAGEVQQKAQGEERCYLHRSV